MYDFNKADLNGVPINVIVNNPYLNFISGFSLKTGETFENVKVSQFNKIENFCTIKNDQYTTLKFSFHKYNNQGEHNHNDFDIKDFLEVIKDLSRKFDLNPFLTVLHNIEFGVNIRLPFSTETFLNSIITYKGNEYRKETYNGKGYLLRFEFEHYELKIYDKGFQYQLNDNILRFEIKVLKMDYLKSKGILVNTYSDLLTETILEKLCNRILKAVNDLLIYSPGIKIKSIKSNREKEILLNGKNPKYWKEIENANTLKSKRKRFKELVLKYCSIDYQKTVYNLINEKLQIITKIETSTEQKINEYLSGFEIKTTPEMTDFITASSKQDYTRNDCSSIGSKEVQQTRYCITCGNDITNQKKGSVFCSEKVFGKDAKKCRNQKSNPENNYKRKELKLYPGVLLLFDISTLKINQARSC